MLEKLLDEAKAMLFDFDGVLADSEYYYYRAYNMAFEKRGHSIKKDEYWEYWTSRGEGIAGEARRYNLDISPEEMAVMYEERKRNFTAFCQEGKIPFFPGMMDALQELKKKGMPIAIGSSSFQHDLETIFEKAGFKELPCVVVGRREGLRPKPHPDIYVFAAGVLGVEPAGCLVVEDAHKGLEAAKTVGMKCVILKNELNRKLAYPDANAVIDDHPAFAAAIGSWKGR